MLEFFVETAAAMDRFRSSPVAEYLGGYAAVLHERGYCKGRAFLGHAVHLGVWWSRRGREVAALDVRRICVAGGGA